MQSVAGTHQPKIRLYSMYTVFSCKQQVKVGYFAILFVYDTSDSFIYFVWNII